MDCLRQPPGDDVYDYSEKYIVEGRLVTVSISGRAETTDMFFLLLGRRRIQVYPEGKTDSDVVRPLVVRSSELPNWFHF